MRKIDLYADDFYSLLGLAASISSGRFNAAKTSSQTFKKYLSAEAHEIGVCMINKEEKVFEESIQNAAKWFLNQAK